MNCLVCGTPLKNKENDCLCCGFHYLNSVGGSFEENFDLQRSRADYYRTNDFLPRFELAVNCYYWKDGNGKIVQASRKRLTFGNAAELQKGTVWLKEKFARMPDGEPMIVEICVLEKNAPERTIRIDMPLIQEPDLLQLGLRVEEGWHLEGSRRVEDGPMLVLTLKTVGGRHEVESKPVKLIAG